MPSNGAHRVTRATIQSHDGQPLPLAGQNVIRVRQSNPRLAASDLLHDDGIAVHDKRLVRCQRATPREPAFFPPELFQRVEVRGCRAELGKGQCNFAAPDFVREFEQ